MARQSQKFVDVRRIGSETLTKVTGRHDGAGDLSWVLQGKPGAPGAERPSGSTTFAACLGPCLLSVPLVIWECHAHWHGDSRRLTLGC